MFSPPDGTRFSVVAWRVLCVSCFKCKKEAVVVRDGVAVFSLLTGMLSCWLLSVLAGARKGTKLAGHSTVLLTGRRGPRHWNNGQGQANLARSCVGMLQLANSETIKCGVQCARWFAQTRWHTRAHIHTHHNGSTWFEFLRVFAPPPPPLNDELSLPGGAECTGVGQSSFSYLFPFLICFSLTSQWSLHCVGCPWSVTPPITATTRSSALRGHQARPGVWRLFLQCVRKLSGHSNSSRRVYISLLPRIKLTKHHYWSNIYTLDDIMIQI